MKISRRAFGKGAGGLFAALGAAIAGKAASAGDTVKEAASGVLPPLSEETVEVASPTADIAVPPVETYIESFRVEDWSIRDDEPATSPTVAPDPVRSLRLVFDGVDVPVDRIDVFVPGNAPFGVQRPFENGAMRYGSRSEIVVETPPNFVLSQLLRKRIGAHEVSIRSMEGFKDVGEIRGGRFYVSERYDGTNMTLVDCNGQPRREKEVVGYCRPKAEEELRRGDWKPGDKIFVPYDGATDLEFFSSGTVVGFEVRSVYSWSSDPKLRDELMLGKGEIE